MKFSDPFKILSPNERWAPTQSQMDAFQNAYEKLLPPLVYKIRLAVAKWRDENYAGASETTKSLLNFWFNQEHLIGQTKFSFFFSQREAIESIVYLYEIANAKDKYELMKFDSSGRISTGMFDENWTRYVVKMATGAGKTKVMGLTLVWSYFHKLYEADSTLSKDFLVIAPNIIVLNRLRKDFSDLKMTFPESDLFFFVNQNGNLQPHSLTSNPIEPLADTLKYTFDQTVLEYNFENKKFYLPKNNQPSIILKNDLFKVNDQSIKEKNWQTALTMQGKWNSQILHPETSDKEWLNLVKYSFLSKVMTPVTSYLVVENEAQKTILKKKQEQVLSSNKSLDLGEDTQRMSEPSLIILTILLGLALWYRQRRQRKWAN
ncbi:MAG: MSEP-CTERM sorting domain-containing protein [Bacteroidetes bacterium]|nr:MSEP-CTERM sorting domain-containing protein [Bacteroidota bacterium]